MKSTFFAIILLLLLPGAVLGTLPGCSETAGEFTPDSMKRKYQWFIQQHHDILRTKETILTFTKSIENIEKRFESYGDKKDWPPHIMVIYSDEVSKAETDLDSAILIHDRLVAEYNRRSDDFFWKGFDNYESLPKYHEKYGP